jgi:hypothetical protein
MWLPTITNIFGQVMRWVIDKHHVYLKSVSVAHKSKRLPNDWKLNIVRTDDGMKTNLVQTVIWWVQKMYLPKVFLLKQSTNQYWQNYQFCKLTEFSWRKISINTIIDIADVVTNNNKHFWPGDEVNRHAFQRICVPNCI